MCKPIHSQELLSKSNLIEEIGGQGQLSFVLINFCEYIKEDDDLRTLFNHMNMKRFVSVMSTLVNAAFDSNLLDGKARNEIVMKNYAFFEVGISKRHFEKFKSHFEAALRNCWIDDTLIEECTMCFAALEFVFDGEGAALRQTARSRTVLASQLQAAPVAA